ncbi:MAG TPA: 2-C-methyl-D-erythritol 2,4-cyclodiphosphate synthase, partial [Tepidiformaceae bacterium]|nr:2-C-methyl-D-erythritol 2,4-cyclodiphosphate synthase [Tepidiformaceae bacterium]
MRIGIGEDIHRVDDSRTLVLGGVIIEEGPGLSGHSDADVLLHAITDAILGAAALGDIGHYFPPSDPRYAHADSADFLRKALELARGAGFAVGNIDATVRAERPRLAPYITHIRERIA